eukprot:9433449-Pyramimonas_sp.AAC.1
MTSTRKAAAMYIGASLGGLRARVPGNALRISASPTGNTLPQGPVPRQGRASNGIGRGASRM